MRSGPGETRLASGSSRTTSANQLPRGVAAEASLWSTPWGEQNEIYVPLAQHPTRTEGSSSCSSERRATPER